MISAGVAGKGCFGDRLPHHVYNMNNNVDWPRYAGQLQGVLLRLPYTALYTALNKGIKGVSLEQREIISEFLSGEINKEIDRIRTERNVE